MKRIILTVLVVILCVLTLGGCERVPETQKLCTRCFLIAAHNASLNEVVISLPKSWEIIHNGNHDAVIQPVFISDWGYKIRFESSDYLNTPVTSTDDSFFECLSNENSDYWIPGNTFVNVSGVGKYYLRKNRFTNTDDMANNCVVFFCIENWYVEMYFDDNLNSKLSFEEQINDFLQYLETMEIHPYTESRVKSWK